MRALLAIVLLAGACAMVPADCAEARARAAWHRRFRDDGLVRRMAQDESARACGTWDPAWAASRARR